MPKLSLERLNAEERSVVMALLHDVAADPAGHQVRARRQPPRAGTDIVYYLTLGSGRRPTSTPPHSHESLIGPLLTLGFARLIDPTNQEVFEFNEAAIAWYRAQMAPTEQEIQRGLATALLAHFRQYRNMHRYNSVDLPAVADDLGVPVERVIDGAYLLIEVGLAQRGTSHTSSSVEEGWVSLTPEGLAWVNDGFPTRGVTNVSVGIDLRFQLHLTIEASIPQVQQLEAPEEFKQQLVEALRELERDPTPDKLQRFMSFGADTATFGQATLIALPFILSFLGETADRFSQLFQFYPL